jgi:hypothetical protein
MIIEEILNELKICHYTYDKKNGVIKASINTSLESNELGKITTALKNYNVIYSVDRKQNIQIEE